MAGIDLYGEAERQRLLQDQAVRDRDLYLKKIRRAQWVGIGSLLLGTLVVAAFLGLAAKTYYEDDFIASLDRVDAVVYAASLVCGVVAVVAIALAIWAIRVVRRVRKSSWCAISAIPLAALGIIFWGIASLIWFALRHMPAPMVH
jgi:hypothetical protein